nr:hypothetical protein Iba_chr13bCG9450 [Ipomoea batatas]
MYCLAGGSSQTRGFTSLLPGLRWPSYRWASFSRHLFFGSELSPGAKRAPGLYPVWRFSCIRQILTPVVRRLVPWSSSGGREQRVGPSRECRILECFPSGKRLGHLLVGAGAKKVAQTSPGGRYRGAASGLLGTSNEGESQWPRGFPLLGLGSPTGEYAARADTVNRSAGDWSGDRMLTARGRGCRRRARGAVPVRPCLLQKKAAFPDPIEGCLRESVEVPGIGPGSKVPGYRGLLSLADACEPVNGTGNEPDGCNRLTCRGRPAAVRPGDRTSGKWSGSTALAPISRPGAKALRYMVPNETDLSLMYGEPILTGVHCDGPTASLISLRATRETRSIVGVAPWGSQADQRIKELSNGSKLRCRAKIFEARLLWEQEQGAHPGSKVPGYRSSDLNGESKVLTPGARNGQVAPLRDQGERGRTGIGHFSRKDGKNLRQVGIVHRHLEGGRDVVLHRPPPTVEGPSAELVHQVIPDRSSGDGSQNGFPGLSTPADVAGEQDGVGKDLFSQVRTLQDSSPGLLGRLELALELLDPLVPLSERLLEGRYFPTMDLVPVLGPGKEISDGVGHLHGNRSVVEVGKHHDRSVSWLPVSGRRRCAPRPRRSTTRSSSPEAGPRRISWTVELPEARPRASLARRSPELWTRTHRGESVSPARPPRPPRSLFPSRAWRSGHRHDHRSGQRGAWQLRAARNGQVAPLRDRGERGRTGIGHFSRKDGQNLRQVGIVHRHLEGGRDVVLHRPPPAVEGPSAELVHQVIPDRSSGDGSQNGFPGLSTPADVAGEQDGVGKDF